MATIAPVAALQTSVNDPRNFTGTIQSAIAWVPSNSVSLPFVTRSIWVNTVGNIAVVFPGGDDAAPIIYTIPSVGRFIIGAAKIMATGTTASNLIAEF